MEDGQREGCDGHERHLAGREKMMDERIPETNSDVAELCCSPSLKLVNIMPINFFDMIVLCD